MPHLNKRNFGCILTSDILNFKQLTELRQTVTVTGTVYSAVLYYLE